MSKYKNNHEYFTRLVRQFHTTFEITMYDHPDKAPLDVHALRARLIKEEIDETRHAKTAVNLLDGYCDTLYVTAGTVITYSTPIMDFTMPIVEPIKPLPILMKYAMPVLMDLYTCFPCQKHLTPSLSTLMHYLEQFGTRIFGYENLMQAFKDVHDNNMEKLWTYSSTEQNHISKEVRPGRWLVKDAGGKVIKPPNHPKVDLSEYAKEAQIN